MVKIGQKLVHVVCERPPREITRLDLMAYLDPASNPRSEPQRLFATNCKSFEMDPNIQGIAM